MKVSFTYVISVLILAGSLGVSGLALYSVMLTLRLGRYYTLGWSYVTTSSACTITFIAAIFMGITNKVETRGAQVSLIHH